MKHHITTVIVAAAVALAVGFVPKATNRIPDSAALPTAAPKESAYDRVLRTGTLRCGYAVADPQIMKDADTGQIHGPVADIAQEMARVLELNVEWTAEVGFADFAEGLKTGRYDAFCGILSPAPQRARVVAFTDPIFYMLFYPYVRVNEKRFKTLEDMNTPEVRAAFVDGEIFQRVTKKRLPKATEYSLPNMTVQGQLFVDIDNGKADVAIHEAAVWQQYEKTNPGKIRAAFPTPLEVFPAAFAVAPQEAELRDMMNVALFSMNNLGVIDMILTQHGLDSSVVYRARKEYEAP